MMRGRMTDFRSERGGLLAKLFFVFVLFLGVASVLWVVLLPGLVVSTIRSRTGFAVKVDQLSVNPFTATVAIRGLVMKNPAGWPAEEFFDLREFRADVSLFSLFSSRFVANEVVLDVAVVTLVKNPQGMVNALVFKEGVTGNPPAGSPEAKKSSATREFLIKRLVLKVDKLVYADYSAARPKIKDYNLNISRDMRDVDSVTKIVSPFSGSALGLITGTLGGAFPNSPGLLVDLKGSLQDAGKKTGEKIKGLLDSLDKRKP